MSKWILDTTDANISLMSQTLGISETASTVLANRGIRSKNAAIRYLRPDLRYLHDLSVFPDAVKAFDLIDFAISFNIRVAVYGDYDVDGVMSTVILAKGLKALGADVTTYIPAREEEGYGLNAAAVESLAKNQVKLLITCDNGIAAAEEIDFAKSLGMNVIVLDHHEPAFALDGEERTDVIPCADAILDAKMKDSPYPNGQICAGGLAFQFIRYMHQKYNKAFHLHDELLIFAAIATICDIVDLLDENRVIVKCGLELINSNANSNIGLLALIKSRNLQNKRIGVFEIGFVLGPCINAAGRLKHAHLSVDLFMAGSQMEAEVLAERLVSANNERKDMTAEAVESIAAKVASEDDSSLIKVIYDENIHESIAGIVAGRMKDMYQRPCIILTKSGDFAKGSARSVEGYHIFEGLLAQKHLLLKFGGHKLAAGLTILPENIEPLRTALNEACTNTAEDFQYVFHYDRELPLAECTYNLACELKQLEPCGKANPEPVFAAFGIAVKSVDTIGENKKTLKFSFDTGAGSIGGICFSQKDKFTEQLKKIKGEDTARMFLQGLSKSLKINMNILFNIDINSYNNQVNVQLKIIDFEIL